ncbi:NADP-dependent oxidoreductase [Paractinoplanes atraurantiacus]|uniref:NADPH:quinone reductase n=1 Tax=Paractinoplanes atraurantiacus TaxID=1036182 RepID=A0A285J1H9_9ACTN|nr:NADP-dependent oxidoreductase [Actinoplanes atraurantiacus]SNY53737.1 NADPH:quinone reductase [Actinoplanes atraurantiacus]
MKAIVARDYGPPESFELADVPIPAAGAGQIQVRIAAASLNPGDIVIPSGAYPVRLEFPHVLGNDFAGTVSAVGEGVTAYSIGDEVFGHSVPRALGALAGANRPSVTTGTLAEYAVFEAGTPFIAHRPDSLDVATAAALPTVGLTARALMIRAEPKPGETVLVIGATGGVGTTVLPLLAGCRVIATGRPEDRDTLLGRGATEVIGYDGYPAEGVDLVLNLVRPTDQLREAAQSLKPGGRLFTITFPPPRPEMIGRDDVRFELVLDVDGDLGGMRDVAGLSPLITGRYSIDDGVQALIDFARNHTVGKLVVTT